MNSEQGKNTVMEILSQLESKIEAILQKTKALEEENRGLRQKMELGLGELESENRRLQEELDRERAGKEAVLARIDELLKKLQEETT